MSQILDDETDDGTSVAESPALSLALNAAAHDESVAAKAAVLLHEQTRLVRLQVEELKKEDAIRHWSLRVRHVNDLLKLAFGISAAVVVTAIALVIVALAWSAYEATGLVIQPLKAPPDFAERGLDGTVLAQRLLDKLNDYVRDADKWSFRAADNVSGNWGNDSKVEIPQTGISIFELSQFLRQELGHETSMSGELYHTPNGIALTVRVGADPGATFEGREQDIDLLLSRAAQTLLKQTQPYRYVWALYDEGNKAAIIAPVARQLAAGASGKELPWLRSAWEEIVQFSGDFRQSEALARQTVALAPGFPFGFFDLAPAEWAMGHLEGARVHIGNAARLLRSGSQADFARSEIPFLLDNCESFADDLSGAYSDAVVADTAESKTGTFDLSISAPGSLANDLTLAHDTAAARSVLAQHPGLNDESLLQPEFISTTGPDMPNFFLHAVHGDLSGARTVIEHTEQVLQARNNVNDVRRSLVWPWLAWSQAQTGALDQAKALIARTPLDCTLCLEMRGRLAEKSGDVKGAAEWYRRAVADAPSLPFSDTDWGTMLLRRGSLDAAIAKFGSANRTSPHFADALELWGEALMVQRRSDLALAKFADAGKYAPNWGRLHLKWGEALWYAGRKDEACVQYKNSAALDLTAADKAESARQIGECWGISAR